MERIRPKPDASLAWAYRPDSDTNAALKRGLVKFKRNHRKTGHVLGADRPHQGGNLAEALVEARKAEAKRRGIGKHRRRKVARKISRKKTAVSKKKSIRANPETGAKGQKLIPLKTICAQMDLDPKATRVKLRRLIEKGDIDWHDTNSRWEFTSARAKEIKAHLSR